MSDARTRRIDPASLLVGSIVLGCVTGLLGFLIGYLLSPRDQPVASVEMASEPTDPATTSTTLPAALEPEHTTAPPLSTIIEPRIDVIDPLAPADRVAPLLIAERLAPSMVLPSDCPLPLESSASLPNSARDYRSGVHQGIDFICGEGGRAARAAASGRVVFLQSAYPEPQIDDRNRLLDTAAAVGRTPSWTLAMLYGNHVVIDHGVIEGVGHVVSVYAHLESVDSELGIGSVVEAGEVLGEIGNTGTSTAATNGDRPQSLHLHWELLVDELYLGAGLDAADTRTVYERLFSLAPGD